MLKRVSNYLIFFLLETFVVCCLNFIFFIISLRNLMNIVYFRLFTIVDDQLGEVKNQSFWLFHCIGVMETGVSGNYFFYCVLKIYNLLIILPKDL